MKTSEILEELDSILADADNYDDDEKRPNSEATDKVKTLLTENAAEIDKLTLPRPHVSLFKGSIRVEWENKKRALLLVVFVSYGDRSFIYHEEEENYETELNPTAQSLCSWLTWLMADNSSS
jgi:hypothetical protein